MKNVVLFLLLVSMLFVAPIVESEQRPTTPPYQGPPGGYGSPGTPDNIPRGMPSPMPLPPPIVFPAPPEMIVIPETYVYVVPEIDVDLFFWNGWWWRLWEGRWYRSRYYDRGWGYYEKVPSFYFDVDPGWRGHYRDHNWYGHRWNYERIPYKRLEKNWKSWQDNRRWEKRGTLWGVQNYQPRSKQQGQELRQQWQQQYHQKPEVRQHQEQIQKQQREQVQKPQKQKLQPKQEKQPQVQQPQHSQPQGKPERGEIEKQDRK